jgi:5-oxoprolinase (ATP-hydrolysing) subunit C
VLEVVEAGPALSLRDRGRPGYAHLGIPPSGAVDPWGLAVANALADGLPGSPALEVVLGGTVLLVIRKCVVALAGADLGAELDDGRLLATDATHMLAAGTLLRFTGSGRPFVAGGVSGIRAYVALAGGIAARHLLGSAAPLAGAARGGTPGGCVLRPGDRLEPARRGDVSAAGRHWARTAAPHPASLPGPIRFVPGPDLRHLPGETAEALSKATWAVATDSDSIGLRLAGTPLAPGREILSHPLVPGAIQVTAGGLPIAILPDGPTLGGYPVVGVAPRSEMPRLGQLAPGDTVTFVPLDPDDARSAWFVLQRSLERGGVSVRAGVAWRRVVPGRGPGAARIGS